jgi:hypothetical protein
MARYIDASEIRYTYRPHTQDNIAYKDEIEKIPTADVAPVVHGHWIYKFRTHDGGYCYECSVCGRYERAEFNSDIENMPHCHCGAKMDENEESEDEDENSERI